MKSASDDIAVAALPQADGQRGTPSAGATTTPRATMTVREVALELGISQAGVREAIRVGQMPHLRFGRRIVIPRRAFDAMLDAQIGPDRREGAMS